MLSCDITDSRLFWKLTGRNNNLIQSFNDPSICIVPNDYARKCNPDDQRQKFEFLNFGDFNKSQTLYDGLKPFDTINPKYQVRNLGTNNCFYSENTVYSSLQISTCSNTQVQQIVKTDIPGKPGVFMLRMNDFCVARYNIVYPDGSSNNNMLSCDVTDSRLFWKLTGPGNYQIQSYNDSTICMQSKYIASKCNQQLISQKFEFIKL